MIPSGTTTYQMTKALQGTRLVDLVDSLVLAEETTGINAIMLASIVAWESAWGTSNRANTQNNLTGYAVYNNLSRGSSFSSKHDNILATAKLLRSDYLEVGGKYYSGKSIWDVNYKYCLTQDGSRPDYKWSEGIINIAETLTKKANA